MPYPQLDRSKLKIHPLADRENKVEIARDAVRCVLGEPHPA